MNLTKPQSFFFLIWNQKVSSINMEGLPNVAKPLRQRRESISPSFLTTTLMAHSQPVPLWIPPNFYPMLLGVSLSSDKDVISTPLWYTPSGKATIGLCPDLVPPCFLFYCWDSESGNLFTQSPWPAASEKGLLESRTHKAGRIRVTPSFANNHGELEVTAGSGNIAEGFTIHYGSLWVPADRGG